MTIKDSEALRTPGTNHCELKRSMSFILTVCVALHLSSISVSVIRMRNQKLEFLTQPWRQTQALQAALMRVRLGGCCNSRLFLCCLEHELQNTEAASYNYSNKVVTPDPSKDLCNSRRFLHWEKLSHGPGPQTQSWTNQSRIIVLKHGAIEEK
ncbi:hypothetical protein NC652_041593 [Populus alba x Populus x berolinensis]|nr:hypothetical protein NC652_041593 [Populus alba x Populus x berolinensis]